MYEAIDAFFASQMGRGMLFAAILLVPALLWAIPAAFKAFKLDKVPHRGSAKSPYRGVWA